MSTFPSAFAPPPGPPPPVTSRPPPPPAGNRYALTTSNPFPSIESLPPTRIHDLAGSHQVVYVGSALFEKSVQPCKIGPHLNPPVSVPYGGQEINHTGRYDLLPIDESLMEWADTSHGRIPSGRRPVEGGYEENGERLFHALAPIEGIWVPGKTGIHLGAAHVPFGGERVVKEGYKILIEVIVKSISY
ncbi:hypothetical protein Clacol_002922 [Clathrus columnatus]|uniref:Uncharacterized protein n=1 Tax=Clathrus columnatus TaxID=1419009 RepID=A0AAV5A5F5_9AGAM|nr:hypothetical protein Clacol_002922 [Clathrus columnatus]